MRYEERVPDELHRDGHYLGRPADIGDKIISRRIALVESYPGFTGTDLELLDIGCGNGASMFLMADKMKHCTGIEVNDDHEEEFKRFKKQFRAENCEFNILNIEKAKPAKQYDRIISFEVIEHLTTEDAVQFYYESLKPGGLMAISVPNKWWIFETHGAKLPLLPWNRVPFFSWLPTPIHEKWAHARIYTKTRIVHLLEKHGFKMKEVQYITAPMDVLKPGKLKDTLIKHVFHGDTTEIPFLSTSIFVVAQRP